MGSQRAFGGDIGSYSGREDDSYFFSRNSAPANGKFLSHVHMVPVNLPEALELWNTNWQRHSRRVSDRYLFYADGGPSNGFLLIAMVDEPGAHEIWNPGRRSEIKTLEEVADRFYHFGEVP